MFKTSAKFSTLASRLLQARRPSSGPQRVPANDTRTAKARARRPLVCHWSLEGGTRLVCHWEADADAPEPNPAHQHQRPATVTGLSYSRTASSRIGVKAAATRTAWCCTCVTRRWLLAAAATPRLPIKTGLQ